MSMENLKTGKRGSKASQLARFLHREGKKYCAIALCASLIAGNIGNMAVAADDGRSNDYEFELDRVSLYEALQEAVLTDQTVDRSFEFVGEAADTYDSLMEANGTLYELKPEIKDNDGALNLRIFARLDGEIELDSAYEIDGSEEMIFLLTNTSDVEKTAVIHVDDKGTEEIKVAPRSAVQSDDQANPYKSAAEITGSPGAVGDITTNSGKGGFSGVADVVVIETEKGTEATEVSQEQESDEGSEKAEEDEKTQENDHTQKTETEDAPKEENKADEDVIDSSDAEITIDTDTDTNQGQEEVREDTEVSVDEPEQEAADHSPVAAISCHETSRVAATPSNTDKATPSDATDSNADPNALDGMVYEVVGLEKDTAVAFVTTAGDLAMDEETFFEWAASSKTMKHYNAELENITVTVNARSGDLPEDAELFVTELKEDDADTAEQFQTAKNALDAKGVEYDGMMALDIRFMDSEENEIEPKHGVQVSIQMHQEAMSGQADPDSLVVHHLDESNTEVSLENVAGEANGETALTGTVEVNEGTAIAEFCIDSFSTFAISWRAAALAVSYTSYKVTFDIGSEAAAAGVEVPEAVMTSTETSCVDSLPTPVWNDANGTSIKSFGGWYSDEELDTEFDTDTTVSQDITVYAKWVEVTDSSYHVNFYSQDGGTVLLTVAVEAGRTVSSANAQILEKKIFKGWSTVKQGDRPVTELVAFDFTETISEVITDGSYTLNLYAWYGDEVSVSFISNGGIAVPTKYIAAGETVAKPITTREGYTFRGWSTSNTEYAEFDFTTVIHTDMTLYAFWNANYVPVTLVYMNENADDDGYTPAGISQTVYAPSGSYVSVVKSTITKKGQTHALKYSETPDGELTGIVYNSANSTGAANIPDISQTYYQYHTASNKRQVMPDGSTVMLVYYNRARITLTFLYETTGGENDSYPNGDRASLSGYSETDKYQVQYNDNNTGNVKFTYSFVAKYGENITPVWPQIGWVSNNSKDNRTFFTWRCPDEHIQSSNMFTLESSLFATTSDDGVKIENGILVGSGKLTAEATKVSVDWLIYARTTLSGETADFKYNNTYYTIYAEACQKAYSSSGYGYKKLDGCMPVNGEPEWRKTYGNLKSSTSLKASNVTVYTAQTSKTIKSIFNDVFGASNIGSDDRCQILLYNRNSLSLSLHVYDDVYGENTKKDTYYYGDLIYNDNTDLLKTVESGMKKEGYIFAGWYTDPSYVDGTQYKPDESSRINANMELYAKWEPDQFKAEYYLYTDDVSPYRTQGFAEGGKLEDFTVPVGVQDSFKGWYWYQDGKLQPFDFTSAVGANHVDKDGVIKLYGVWEGDKGKVCYLPGIGGDNNTQTFYDNRDFAVNDASVQLPDPKDVWNNGSVPSDPSLSFVGWKAPNGAIYQPGRYVLVTRILMQFEAQWSKDAVTLIYDGNGGSGQQVTEQWERNSNVDIWDNMDANTPHFVRDGYELVGWDEDKDAVEPTYALGEGSIALTKDTTTLYAIWKKQTVDVVITKQVTGILGDRSKAFSFIVTCDSAMEADAANYTLTEEGKKAEFSLGHGNNITLKGIRIGSTLTIAESNIEGYTMTLSSDDVTFDKDSCTIPENITDQIHITVTNDKTGNVDAGVLLDSLPYALILGAVAAGIAFYVIRKRKEDENDLD